MNDGELTRLALKKAEEVLAYDPVESLVFAIPDHLFSAPERSPADQVHEAVRACAEPLRSRLFRFTLAKLGFRQRLRYYESLL